MDSAAAGGDNKRAGDRGGAVLRIQGGRGILCLRIVCCAWRGHKLLRRGHAGMRRDKADRKEAVRLIFGPLRTIGARFGAQSRSKRRLFFAVEMRRRISYN